MPFTWKLKGLTSPSGGSGFATIKPGRVRRWALSLALAAVAGPAILFIDNNLSWKSTSRQTFRQQLDTAIDRSTQWLAAREQETNPALLYMIADMAALSGEARLRRILDGYLNAPFTPRDSIWRRLADPTSQVRIPSRAELEQFGEYQRWIAYGLAPQEVPLTDAERSDLFSAEKYMGGKRTHQLFALLMYRKHGPNPATVNDLINHLCERIAVESRWDFRVSDLYLQRTAFLLAAGRPDLVRRRWVERIVAGQEANGGWTYSWHGWGPGPWEFHLANREPDSHPTVQGMWTVYMLKHQYPEWIAKHYP